MDNGAKVVLVDINKDALERAKASLNAEPDRVVVIGADVTNEEDVKNYVKQTVDAFGKIDVFFNNAGINGPFAQIKDLEKEKFEQILNINVTGVFLGLKHVIKQMEVQGYGSIINTASNAAYIGSAGMAGYIAS